MAEVCEKHGDSSDSTLDCGLRSWAFEYWPLSGADTGF